MPGFHIGEVVDSNADFQSEFFLRKPGSSNKPARQLREWLQKIGRNTGSPTNKPYFNMVRSPKDQHWGKIIGGSALITGGILGFSIFSMFMEPQARPVAYTIYGSMFGAGSAFLTIGIIRQKRYYDVH